MTIGKKLIGGYAVVLVLLAVVTIVAINALQQTRTTYDRFLDVNARQVNYADDKQASTQNVAGTRQAEVAAQNLHELGLRLR